MAIRAGRKGDDDLPPGYRWAEADECERIAAGEITDYLVVKRTVDSNGAPYTQGEADLAVPTDIR